MGVVYLCRDMVTGDRVALKRLRSPENGETRPRRELVVSSGSARGVAARPSGNRSSARLRPASGWQPVFRDGYLPGRSVHEWMHTMRCHGRSSGRWSIRSGGAGARPCAWRHSRRPEAIEHDARSRFARSRSARLRLGLGSRMASRVQARLTTRRGAGPRGRRAFRCGYRWMGGTRADPAAVGFGRPRHGHVRAGLRHVPRA